MNSQEPLAGEQQVAQGASAKWIAVFTLLFVLFPLLFLLLTFPEEDPGLGVHWEQLFEGGESVTE